VQDDPACAKGLRGTGSPHAFNREIVLCETLYDRPMSSSVSSPWSRRFIASRFWWSVSFGFLPIFMPRALARSRPSPVRAAINSRSNSASPTRTVNIRRPCAVVALVPNLPTSFGGSFKIGGAQGFNNFSAAARPINSPKASRSSLVHSPSALPLGHFPAVHVLAHLL
jgi:hypothetical protein